MELDFKTVIEDLILQVGSIENIQLACHKMVLPFRQYISTQYGDLPIIHVEEIDDIYQFYLVKIDPDFQDEAFTMEPFKKNGSENI